jgi:hypothetical protein
MTSWPDHLPSGDRKRFFKLARLLVGFDHVACFIVNADQAS